MRLYFEAWEHGAQSLRKIPAYAIRKQSNVSAAHDVVDAIARANNLVSASVRRDSGAIYQATLGKLCRGGGVSVVAEIWFRIDAR